MPRDVYVISDLHLGGRAPTAPGERGFQMMTHPGALAAFIERVAGTGGELVINGDFVDFLAEEDDEGGWTAFRDDPDAAVGALEAIAERVPEVFRALGKLEGRLTVLLGNHDLELSFPDVRRVFEARAGLSPFGWRFSCDNEALVVGTALVEHGNRYDPANVVDHDRLRRLRSLHSRRMYAEAEAFTPPPGSQLVASVMNAIKVDYPFIDLLKPESEPLFAVVLALDPDQRAKLGKVAWSLRGVPARAAGGLFGHVDPVYRAEISSAGDDPLDAVLAVSVRDSSIFADERGPQDISAAGARALLEGLLLGREWGWERRVARIQAALRAIADDQTFSRDVETGARYLDAATRLSDGGLRFSHVVFGHTHHPKDHPLLGGGRYLNSGTWADLMRFPAAALDPDADVARAAIAELLVDCGSGRVDRYVEFQPGCVHIAVGDRTEARYRPYDAAADQILD